MVLSVEIQLHKTILSFLRSSNLGRVLGQLTGSKIGFDKCLERILFVLKTERDQAIRIDSSQLYSVGKHSLINKSHEVNVRS